MSTIRANIITDAAGTGTPVFTNGFVTSTFTASGNVGIGTGSPLANLHVVNGTNATLRFPTGDWAVKVFQQNDASTYGGLVVGNRWAADASTIFEAGSLYGSGGASWSSFFKITGLGAIGLSGSNYGTTGQVLTSSGPSAVPSWTSRGFASATLTDKTGSRANGTTYQNTTNGWLFVSVRDSNNGQSFSVGPSSASLAIFNTNIAPGTAIGLVPPGYYYSISGSTLQSWYEGQA